MTNRLHTEKTNIDKFPLVVPVEEGHQLTLGDLHGNALKLFHYLVKHEIVVCSTEDYAFFVRLYKKENATLTLHDLSQMRDFCMGLTIKNRIKICFLGDCLADRGENDFFTLLLFNKLHQELVPFDILLSNHDFTFIQGFENGFYFRSDKPSGTLEFARSMHHMQNLIDANLLSVNEIIDLAQSAYFPNLKLLSYTIGNDEEITYYSHARIDEEVITYTAQQMGVILLNFETVFESAACVETINYFFQKHFVEKNIISTLSAETSESKSDPITFLMWNRKYDILQTPIRTYKVNVVHGHDLQGPLVEGVYCLDTLLGYNIQFHQGHYKTLISNITYPSEGLVSALVEKKILECNKIQENNFINYSFSTYGFWSQGDNFNRDNQVSNHRCLIS